MIFSDLVPLLPARNDSHLNKDIFPHSRISEKGTLQLSIDCDSLKRALSDFPAMARPVGMEMELPGFMSYVEREMGTVVNTVKVSGSPAELPMVVGRRRSLISFTFCDYLNHIRPVVLLVLRMHSILCYLLSVEASSAERSSGAPV